VAQSVSLARRQSPVDLSPLSFVCFSFPLTLSFPCVARQRWSRHTCPSRALFIFNMLVMLLAMLVALLAIPCVLAPEKIWKAFTDGDDGSDYGLQDVNLVSLRNPIRETGPPVCMAKLIMLRHKINQSGQKKRRLTGHARHSRSVSRATNLHHRPRAFAWMKFGKQMH